MDTQSTIVCLHTGIVVSIQSNLADLDSDLVFSLNHPLANYSQVVKTFQYKLSIKDTPQHRSLLAGSILSVLKHHKIVRLHGREQALWANQAMCAQARKASQLLALLHRLISNEDRLKVLKQGIKVKGEKYKREFCFTLEACTEMGQEYEGESRYFLQNLTNWIGELLPPTTSELMALDSQVLLGDKHTKELDGVEQIQLDDGRMVQYSDIVEHIRCQLEDDIYKKVKRMPRVKLDQKVLSMIKLVASEDYGELFSKKQVSKLADMLKLGQYDEVILGKVIDKLNRESLGKGQKQRNKIFECIGWLKASNLEFKTGRYAQQAFMDIVHAGLADGQAASPKNETLKDRLARLAGVKA